MKRIIFSIFVDIPTSKLDNPGDFTETGVQNTTTKSRETRNAFKLYYSFLKAKQEAYAKSIGVEYRLFGLEYEIYAKDIRKSYPMISEYDIINFYKHELMSRLASTAAGYDQVCYLDFDVVPCSTKNIFDEHDVENHFVLAESNAEAEWGKEINSKDFNTCIRNPASKYWNTHAMLSESGYDGHTDVFNTGIMIASTKLINKLNYFGYFGDTIKLMTQLKTDPYSMYPPNIQRVFNYDNETVFAFKQVMNKVPIQFLSKKWHYPVREETFDPAYMYHVINKRFDLFI